MLVDVEPALVRPGPMLAADSAATVEASAKVRPPQVTKLRTFSCSTEERYVTI